MQNSLVQVRMNHRLIRDVRQGERRSMTASELIRAAIRRQLKVPIDWE